MARTPTIKVSELMHMPTTSGEHCTNDAIKMGKAHLDKVQVHPAGLVKPDAPAPKIVFFSEGKLRGIGGLIVHEDSNHFANEFRWRD